MPDPKTFVIVAAAFVAGLVSSELTMDATAQQPKKNLVHDTSLETITKVRKSISGSKWALGNGDWQQFLSEMKTTNQLNRTGNWVVTDEKTALTGERGTDGAEYIWKFDPRQPKATIFKYVRDANYKRSAVRID